MTVLFIGDIIGRPGRSLVKEFLPKIKEQYEVDYVIANCENLSHGRGANEKAIEEMRKNGIDFFTSGNHIYAFKSIIPKLDEKKYPVIRPANFPPVNPGKGFQVVEAGNMKQILIVNVMGRVFMNKYYDCPFRVMDKILVDNANEHLDAIIVDIHGEATSEKAAFAEYLDGKVSAVVGTHTHVPTADARILENGTAFITDVGMVGVEDSIIGAEKEPIIKSFFTQMPFKYEVADNNKKIFGAVLIDINTSGNATEIKQIIERFD
jgi:metallophosphoesterase (TIGR00282 family)